MQDKPKRNMMTNDTQATEEATSTTTTTTTSKRERRRTNGKEIAKVKRMKYLKKQQRKQQLAECNGKGTRKQHNVDDDDDDGGGDEGGCSSSSLALLPDEQRMWIKDHGEFCTFVDASDVRSLRRWLSGSKERKRKRPRDAKDKMEECNSETNVKNEQERSCSIRGDDEKDRDLSAVAAGGGNTETGQVEEEKIKKLWELLGPYLDLKDSPSSSKGVDGTSFSSLSTTINQGRNPYSSDCTDNDRHGVSNRRIQERYFIAEGTETVRLLIQKSIVKYYPSTTKQQSMDYSKENRNTDDDSDAARADAKGDENNNAISINNDIRVVSILTKPCTFFQPPVNLRSNVERVCSLLRTNPSSNTESTTTSDVPITTSSTANTPISLSPPSNESATEKINNRPPFHVIVASEETLTQIAGFHIARGAMGCGIVPTHRDEAWLYHYLKAKKGQYCLGDAVHCLQISPYNHDHHKNIINNNINNTNNNNNNIRILALDQICDTSNLGSLIRTSAAMGIDAMILSNDCCDAWYRRAVRVSMGHVLTVPTVRVGDLAEVLSTLKSLFDISSYAAVVSDDNDDFVSGGGGGKYSNKCLVLEKIAKNEISKNWCCVVGNEGHGISGKIIDACDWRIRIDMVGGGSGSSFSNSITKSTESGNNEFGDEDGDGVDSLSVGVAAGILLHGMRERELQG